MKKKTDRQKELEAETQRQMDSIETPLELISYYKKKMKEQYAAVEDALSSLEAALKEGNA